MTETQKFTALKLYWGQVFWCIEKLLTALLRRHILCTPQAESDGYWGVKVIDDRFTTAEIVQLVSYVGGDATMMRRAVPEDSNFTKSLDMDLCQALLKHVLNLEWEAEHASEDALWIMGNYPETIDLPNMEPNLLFVDSKMVDCSRLMPKDEFVEKLFSEGGTFTDLAALCEANECEFGTPLYWMHPITDGRYNGCYFVMVREGVLALSYNTIDSEDHEVFDRESARLCSSVELGYFIGNWNAFSHELNSTLESLLFFLERKEAAQDAEG